MSAEETTTTPTVPVRLDVMGVGGKVLYACEFVKEKIVLGRILSADLRIDDPRVSRIHALMEIKGKDIVVTDLASSHGTFLNGKKIIEAKLKFGDTIRLGVVEVRLEKGSGKATTVGVPAGDSIVSEEATQVDIKLENRRSNDRRQTDRRKKDAFPGEGRLDERRDGDRRIEQRKQDRRKTENTSAASSSDRRSAKTDRRTPRDWERRVGERRKQDRRVFDITSLERRIEDRRTRKGDDDVLPGELEAAFDVPDHARELEVTALWGDHILDVSNYCDPVVINVGESPKNTYIIPSDGIPDEFPLVTIEDDGIAYLAFTDDMVGTVRARDKIYDLKQLSGEKFVKRYGDYFILPIKRDDFAKISIGSINFFVLYVKPAPRIRPAPLLDKDQLLLRTFIGSALLMLFIIVGLLFVPEPTPVTIEMIPERFAKIVIKKRPKIPEKTPKAKPVNSGSKKAEGGKPKKAEAKATKKKETKPKQPPKAKRAKAKKSTKPKKRRRTRKRKVVNANKVKKVGLLEAFSNSSLKKDLKKLVDKDTGVDAFNKGIRSSRGRVSGGAAGQGLKGVNVGGGGKTIGIDGPSTKGIGGGSAGAGFGEGIQGPGRLGRKGEHSVSIVSENVQVLSGLPKDVINRIVQRHRGEIRQCYEAARRANPGLRGKVVVRFTIQPSGIVSSAGVVSSTVGSRALQNCIVARVRSWRFPKPEAPVVTNVGKYPFYLNPGN